MLQYKLESSLILKECSLYSLPKKNFCSSSRPLVLSNNHLQNWPQCTSGTIIMYEFVYFEWESRYTVLNFRGIHCNMNWIQKIQNVYVFLKKSKLHCINFENNILLYTIPTKQIMEWKNEQWINDYCNVYHGRLPEVSLRLFIISSKQELF